MFDITVRLLAFNVSIFIASWAVAALPLRTELKLPRCSLIGGFQSKAVQPRAAGAGERRMMDIAKLNCLVHVKTGDLIETIHGMVQL